MGCRSIAALAALMAAFCVPASAADPPHCKVALIAEWPVSLRYNQPVVEGLINGKKVGIMLDTGSFASILTKDAAERMGLGTWMTNQRVVGIGGDSRITITNIEELRIGDAMRRNLRVRVAGERPFRGVDFILGEDFFKHVDVEFDYAKRIVRLFEPRDCEGAWLGYWDRNAVQVPIDEPDRIILSIMVNGREARTELDSGASRSLMSLAFAAKIGITPDTPGVQPASCAYGMGEARVSQWVAPLDTVAIGGETVRNVHMYMANFYPDIGALRDRPPELLLGADFLQSHRVYVSRYQQKAYFSYAGGQVFQAAPALGCDEHRNDKGAKEALEGYDKAIAANPNDTKALLSRAGLRGRDEPKAALADLDAAIRLEPHNAVALGMRANVRGRLNDYEGSLADSDAAIASGMRTDNIYDARGFIRMSQGDWPRAIDEFDEALKIDPRDEVALRNQGPLLYGLERYEAAERNYETALAMRSNRYDSIWLYFSRARRGVDARDVLEEAAAKLPGDEWPAPVIQYLLGKIDRAALMAAAAQDEKQRKARECEARFYVAQRLIVEGRRDDARPLLQEARDQCPSGFSEQLGAAIQLWKDSVTSSAQLFPPPATEYGICELRVFWKSSSVCPRMAA